MLPLHQPDRIEIAFDERRLVANAGLLLPVTLAHHLGLGELVDRHVDLGDAPGRANVGDKLLTLVASALAGGDCIDDADALRAGETAQVLGCAVKAPSTLGTFLRSFQWGHARQLDRVSREVLARAWGAGAGPGEEPLTIDLDSIRRRRTRPLDWSRPRPAPQLHRPARLSPSASAGAISSRPYPHRPDAPDSSRIRQLNRSSSARIRLLTRGGNSSIPVVAPSADQSVIRDNLLASSISGSGDPVASVGIDWPVGAWDRQ